jgi:hypothetical protein
MRASSGARAAYAILSPVLILFEEPTIMLGTDRYKYCIFSGRLFPEPLARMNYVCIVAGGIGGVATRTETQIRE